MVSLFVEAIKAQFDAKEYQVMKAFRQEFRETLKQVLVVYPTARIDETPEGTAMPIAATSPTVSMSVP